MAQTKCIKCGSTRFESKPATITGLNFKKNAIQCASCGGVVNFVSYWDSGELIRILAHKMKINLDS